MPPKPTSTLPKKRKRRKKSRYKTGIHNSIKCKLPIKYRSGWEFTICLYLDQNPDVAEYSYEALAIPYIANVKSKKVRHYYPDFLVTYADGHQVLAEVKRQNQVMNIKVVKKAEAARLWCAKQNPQVSYEFWTDKMILPLQKAQKLREQQTVPKKK
ncbi:MAG: TnsA endonuclease N-terminal domain-containing protein [Candidatus Paceibacterota bacterium]|jgi:hypothetical protein